MERRFVGVFDALADRQTRGETFRSIMSRASTDELIAALAVAGARDGVAANAIATELLNRYRRAPFLGGFLVSAAVFVAIYVLDFAYTGTFLLLDSGARAYLLAGASFATALISLLFLLMWRGSFRRLRLALAVRRRSY